MADAERTARSITSESSKAIALAEVAKALAATDPDRAARLMADADASARSITSESSKATALAEIARALAATDPDRAERIAQSITSEYLKASVLAEVATALAATDPDRAERIARSITSESYEVSALANLAKALAATDPDRARLSGNPRMRVWQLADRRRGSSSWWCSRSCSPGRSGSRSPLSSSSPTPSTGPGEAPPARDSPANRAQRAVRLIGDAEHIAQSITNKYWKASALAEVATALAQPTAPPGSRGTHRPVHHQESSKASALAGVAKALAATDPDRAERIARSITDEFWKARALVMIAEA